jgi:hypothetical protein
MPTQLGSSPRGPTDFVDACTCSVAITSCPHCGCLIYQGMCCLDQIGNLPSPDVDFLNHPSLVTWASHAIGCGSGTPPEELICGSGQRGGSTSTPKVLAPLTLAYGAGHCSCNKHHNVIGPQLGNLHPSSRQASNQSQPCASMLALDKHQGPSALLAVLLTSHMVGLSGSCVGYQSGGSHRWRCNL